jgi:hypothetical protein
LEDLLNKGVTIDIRPNGDVFVEPTACPQCARFKAEISDAWCLAYNLDPDRTEPSEMGLCEQINHLGEHITRFREKLDREKMIETVLAGTKGKWTYDTLTDFLIKYLTE